LNNQGVIKIQHKGTERKRKKLDMPKDPICGMEVEESKAVKLEKNGEIYFFCSKSCQDKFLNKTKDGIANKSQDSDGG